MKALKRKLSILFSTAVAVCCGVIGVGALKTQPQTAAATATTPTLTIESNNLSYSESIYMLYAVSNAGFDRTQNQIQLLFWEEAQEEYTYGTHTNAVITGDKATVKEKDCLIYYSRGLAAKEMTVDLYARAYVEVDGVGYYSEVSRFSVLEYVYTMRENNSPDEVTNTLFTEMLDYGAAAQLKFGYKTDKLANAEYYKVTVKNGTFSNGHAWGRFQAGESVTLTADPAPEGQSFAYWVDGGGNVVGMEESVTVEVTASKTYTAVYQDADAPSGDIVEGGAPTICATFTFGENGNAVHNDGKEITTEKAYTDGDYTLTLTGASKAYYDARDEKGNSTLKLGTSSAIGLFTFTVPEEVVSVELEVAKYKANTSKVTVNGGEAQTLLSNSNDGEYDVITVDTSVVKTITVSTVSGAARAMVNTVIWYAKTQVSQGLEYTLNEDGASYTVSGIGTCKDTDIVIPEKCNGLPVTAIGDYAFDSCESMTSIVIPDSVISIGQYAFYENTNITSVSIPDSVTTIGQYAFAWCRSLTSVEIGEGVTRISEYAFAGCSSLTDITVNENNGYYQSIDGNLYTKDGATLVRYAIGKTATEFIIPNSVNSIGAHAFQSCESLTSVEIPDGVESIGSYAFANCSSLTSLAIPNSVTRIDPAAYSQCSSLTSVEFPDSVTSIEDYMFYYCTNLTSVVIPDSVTNIGTVAFANCYNLTSIVIPESVTSIAYNAFSDCDNLTIYCEAESQPEGWDSEWNSSNCPVVWGYIISSQGLAYTLNEDGVSYSVTGIGICEDTDLLIPATYEGLPVTKIGDYAFDSYESMTSIVIPDSVKSIGEYAFTWCKGLEDVVIPDGVKTIGFGAFYGCEGLTSVVIGNGVTTIDTDAFSECKNLTSVTIPDSVTSIGSYAFYNCTSLASVVIGDGVTSIDMSAFADCVCLRTVYYKGTEETWGNITIDSGNADLTSVATRYYYSETEPAVNAEGTAYDNNYWYYVDGEITVWDFANHVHSYADGVCTVCGAADPDYEEEAVKAIYATFDFGENGEASHKDGSALSDPAEYTSSSGETLTLTGLSKVYGPAYDATGNSCIKIGTGSVVGSFTFTVPDCVVAVDLELAKYKVATSIAVINGVEYSLTLNSNDGQYEVITVDTSTVKTITVSTKTGGVRMMVNTVVWYHMEKVATYSEGLEYTLNEDGESYSVTGIGECTDTDIIIPATYKGLPVTVIGDSAFKNCSSLTSIAIPDSVTSIVVTAFKYCYNLTDITVAVNNEYYQSIDGNLYSKDGKKIIYYASGKTEKEFSIPDGVESIGMYAFESCSALESVIIPDGATTINSYAFYWNLSLKNVTIPESVTAIGQGAFYRCAITSASIPSSITSIPAGMFFGCINLTTVTLPSTLTAIGLEAFYYCSNLTDIVIPNGVVSIGANAFDYCSALTSIILPASITSLSYYAFGHCDNLTIYCEAESDPCPDSIWSPSLVKLPYYYSESEPTEEGNYWHYVDGVVTVWEYVAPTYSQGLAYTLNDDGESYSVTGIGECTDTDIIIPATYEGLPVTVIGDSAFINNANLVSVTIPNSVTVVENNAFESCSALESVYGGEAIQTFKAESFLNCVSLANVSVNNACVQIGEKCFYGDTNLSITIYPESLQIIGSEALGSAKAIVWNDENSSTWSFTVKEGMARIKLLTQYEYTMLYNQTCSITLNANTAFSAMHSSVHRTNVLYNDYYGYYEFISVWATDYELRRK